MVVVPEAAAASHGDEPWIPDLGEDHGSHRRSRAVDDPLGGLERGGRVAGSRRVGADQDGRDADRLGALDVGARLVADHPHLLRCAQRLQRTQVGARVRLLEAGHGRVEDGVEHGLEAEVRHERGQLGDVVREDGGAPTVRAHELERLDRVIEARPPRPAQVRLAQAQRQPIRFVGRIARIAECARRDRRDGLPPVVGVLDLRVLRLPFVPAEAALHGRPEDLAPVPVPRKLLVEDLDQAIAPEPGPVREGSIEVPDHHPVRHPRESCRMPGSREG